MAASLLLELTDQNPSQNPQTSNSAKFAQIIFKQIEEKVPELSSIGMGHGIPSTSPDVATVRRNTRRPLHSVLAGFRRQE